MKMLLIDLGACFLFLALFIACGLGAIVPLRSQIRFPLAAAAPAGMLLLSSLSLAIQVVTQVPFQTAIVVCAISLATISVIACIWSKLHFGKRSFLVGLVLFLLCVVGCLTMLHREFQLNSPTLMFGAGSDQFGYAQFADWLSGRPGNAQENLDPTNAFGSWLDIMLKFDPRAGSFSLLALVSNLSQRPGIFAYNLTCTLALICAALGLAGVYARTATGFLLVSIGVFLSSWYNVATSGYLGKLVGYPSILFVIGMTFAFFVS